MKQVQRIAIVMMMFAFVAKAFAASPVGTWTTIDDKTGKKRAVVQLSMHGDTLSGRIIKVYKQEGDTGICSKCPGQFKDKPIKGIQFVWGLKRASENEWAGGQILDPKTGKIYNAKMTMEGDKLYVRGYVGFSLLGRTQVWVK